MQEETYFYDLMWNMINIHMKQQLYRFVIDKLYGII